MKTAPAQRRQELMFIAKSGVPLTKAQQAELHSGGPTKSHGIQIPAETKVHPYPDANSTPIQSKGARHVVRGEYCYRSNTRGMVSTGVRVNPNDNKHKLDIDA